MGTKETVEFDRLTSEAVHDVVAAAEARAKHHIAGDSASPAPSGMASGGTPAADALARLAAMVPAPAPAPGVVQKRNAEAAVELLAAQIAAREAPAVAAAA